MDMCVERACIALLLGKTDQALQQLGLTAQGQQQAGANPTQQAATNYVLVRRPSGSCRWCADAQALAATAYCLQLWAPHTMLCVI